jgi:membrane peptidoglycan carboxypeptidase
MLENETNGESNWRGPRRRKPPFYKRFWFKGLFMLLLLGVASSFFVWTIIVEPLRQKAETFDLEEIKKLEVASIIYDRHGGELSRIALTNRTPVPLSLVPKHFQEALIAQEDSRFYEHHGVDFIGVFRAVYLALRLGEVTQGASTITQQLSRQAFSLLERSYKRKILEMYLAQRVERYYTKPEILELYLNRIFFGSGNGQNFYGVQAAAQGYFGKDVKDLSLEESATIVGLIKAPNRLSPIRNPTDSITSRNHVLDRMVEEGFITKEVATAAQIKAMIVSAPTASRQLSYFYDEVRRMVIAEVGEERAATGGFRIFTTIDPKLQKASEESVQRRLTEVEGRPGYTHQTYAQYHALLADWKKRIKDGSIAPHTPRPKPEYLQGAALTIDNGTGAILAVVGGRDFVDSQYNRALSAGALRSTGTAFLPVFYATAFNRTDIYPGTQVRDTYMDNRFVMVGAIEGLAGEWGEEKEEATIFKGRITAREALSRSRIAATVYLGRDLFGNGQTDKVDMPIDFKPLKEMSQALGIAAALEELPATFVGKSGARLHEMVTAYSTFANQGRRPQKLHLVNRITDFNDAPIYQITDEDTELKEAIDPITAWQTHSCLVDSLDSGTGSAARAEFGLGNFPAAGKTGTHYGFRDLWHIGYTTAVTCGVWVGFDTAKEIYVKAYSNRIALPIWCDVMNATVGDYVPSDFSQPQGLQRVEICKRSGLRATEFCFDKSKDEKTGVERTLKATYFEWARPQMLLDNNFCTQHTGEGLALDLQAFQPDFAGPTTADGSPAAISALDPKYAHISPVRMQSLTILGTDPFESVKPIVANVAETGDGTTVKRATAVDEGGEDGTLPIKLEPPKPTKIE